MAREFQALRFQVRRPQVGRPRGVDRRWLPTLIDAMEQVAAPELRNRPCDASMIAAASAHLARPASAFGHYGSAYSLRN